MINLIILLIIIFSIFIIYIYIYTNYYLVEKFPRVYAGTRLCNFRGCDVRYVTEYNGKLCLK